MDQQLDGARVLLTGRTKGIGAAIVAEFLAEGADVAMCARTAEDVEAAVAAAGGPGTLRGAVVDVAHRDEVFAWVDDVVAELGGIDAVVANVSAIAAANDQESWRLSLDVDLMGTVALVDASLPHLRRGGGGRRAHRRARVRGSRRAGRARGHAGRTDPVLATAGTGRVARCRTCEGGVP